MNVLLALNNYSRLTGSEIYIYELSRVLHSRGHRVHILGNQIGGEIREKTEALGVKVFSFFDHPSFKIDVMHLSQPGPTAYCLKTFPHTPAVITIHSHLVYEDPIINKRISTYVCIRPEIKQHIDTSYPQIADRTIVIYNGVDRSRFTPTKGTPNTVLFVGTNDHLRAQVVHDLKARCERDGKELVLVGEGFPHKPVWNIETYVKQCSQTAGIYLGRTTIEGWMCGKPGWIYDVDEHGAIRDLVLTDPPKDLTQFDIEYMTDRLLEVYIRACETN